MYDQGFLIPDCKFNIIKSLCLTESILIFVTKASIYSSDRTRLKWLHSGLSGFLLITIDRSSKLSFLSLIDESNYSQLFKMQITANIVDYLRMPTAEFSYLPINKAFLGFHILCEQDATRFNLHLSSMNDDKIRFQLKNATLFEQSKISHIAKGRLETISALMKDRFGFSTPLKEQQEIIYYREVYDLLEQMEGNKETINRLIHLGRRENLFKPIKRFTGSSKEALEQIMVDYLRRIELETDDLEKARKGTLDWSFSIISVRSTGDKISSKGTIEYSRIRRFP